MVVDCHYHHAPDEISAHELIQKMDNAGIDKTALMPPICGPIPETPDHLTLLMRFTLNRSLLRPIAKKLITRFTEDGNISLPTGVVEIVQKPDNSIVFDAVDQHPDRLLAWCMVNPNGPVDPVDEYKKWMDHPACIGVKAHPFWHRFEPSKLLRLSEILIQKKLPLILHLGFDSHGDVLTLSNELPELKIILAHTAFPCYRDTWRQIKNRKNITVDLSATAYVDMKIIQNVSDFLGIERCMYGTDGPFGSHTENGFDPGVIKRTIETVFTDKGHQRCILGENFLEFIAGR